MTYLIFNQSLLGVAGVFLSSSLGFYLCLAASYLLLLALLAFFSLLFKRAFIGALVLAVPVFALSVSDFFKFASLGIRISFIDIKMLLKVNDLVGFKTGSLQINWMFVACVAVTGLYILALGLLRVRLRFSLWPRVIAAAVLGVFILCAFASRPFSRWFFHCQIQALGQPESSAQVLALSPVDCFMGTIFYPDGPDTDAAACSQQAVADILSGYGTTASREQPDVIVMMSESYFDLRGIDGIKLKQNLYRSFDALEAGGAHGKLAVSTFGGGTCITEFEVSSGISDYILGDDRMPSNFICDQFETMFSPLSATGYHTAFFHPFDRTFYDRDQLYPRLGYDQLVFQDNMTVPHTGQGRYASDSQAVDQIIDLLGNGEQHNLIYTVTMQNHVPYVFEQGESADLVDGLNLTAAEQEGMNYYARGIARTDEALGKLKAFIDGRSKPTVLVFFADHQPALDGYLKAQGITSRTIFSSLENLETDYFIYTNFDTGKAYAHQGQTLSAFYLLPAVYEYTGMAMTPYQGFLAHSAGLLPVYTCHYVQAAPGVADAQVQKIVGQMKILAYDRLKGRQYSFQN